MSYENIKKELTQVVQDHYQAGTPINDIRAAVHAAGLLAEQYGVLEFVEIARGVESKAEKDMVILCEMYDRDSLSSHGDDSDQLAEIMKKYGSC